MWWLKGLIMDLDRSDMDEKFWAVITHVAYITIL